MAITFDVVDLSVDPEGTGTALQVTVTEGLPAERGLPAGGTANQVLAKVSEADYDVAWVNDGVGGGGSMVVLDSDGTVTVDGSSVELATDAQLTAHEADTTNVHGIADTAALATTADVTAGISAASAADRDRANHTGTQTSTTISDFSEAVQDAVAALLAAGTAISLSYNDAGDSLTITGTGGTGGLDAEAVRDAIGVALIGSGLISVTVNDAADTITISTTATANSTDAQLRDRTTHTGTQAISTVTGLQTALDGKAASTHTHAQSDVTGLTAALDGKAAAADLTAHLSDTTDAHDASAISYAGATGVTATDVEGALDELAAEKVQATGTVTKLHGPITQAAYDALTPATDTLYVIVG